MYFNIRVFAITQTYIGFKIIEKHYEEYKNQNKHNNMSNTASHGNHYNLLREKYFP